MSSYADIIQNQVTGGANQVGQALQIRPIIELIQLGRMAAVDNDNLRQNTAYTNSGTATPSNEQQDAPNPSPAPMPCMNNDKDKDQQYYNSLVPTLG